MDPVNRGEWNGQWFQDKPQPQAIREAEGPVLEMSEDGDATLHAWQRPVNDKHHR